MLVFEGVSEVAELLHHFPAKLSTRAAEIASKLAIAYL
jgi:hypothetical protein